MRRNWYAVVQRAWAVSGVPATSDEETWSQCQLSRLFQHGKRCVEADRISRDIHLRVTNARAESNRFRADREGRWRIC